jgi:hypothetical protein
MEQHVSADFRKIATFGIVALVRWWRYSGFAKICCREWSVGMNATGLARHLTNNRQGGANVTNKEKLCGRLRKS